MRQLLQSQFHLCYWQAEQLKKDQCNICYLFNPLNLRKPEPLHPWVNCLVVANSIRDLRRLGVYCESNQWRSIYLSIFWCILCYTVLLTYAKFWYYTSDLLAHGLTAASYTSDLLAARGLTAASQTSDLLATRGLTAASHTSDHSAQSPSQS